METALFYISKPLLSRLPPLRGMVSTKGELYRKYTPTDGILINFIAIGWINGNKKPAISNGMRSLE